MDKNLFIDCIILNARQTRCRKSQSIGIVTIYVGEIYVADS